MKSIVAFIAGAVFLSSAFANDHGAAERFKMKTGRDLPAAEANAQNSGEAKHSCDNRSCCSRKQDGARANTPSWGDQMADARFRMKYGRPSPNEQARIEAARAKAELTRIALSNDCDGDCCKHHM